jgi:serine/threonine protein kinase
MASATRGHHIVRTLAVGNMATTFEMAASPGGDVFVCKRLLPRYAADPEAARLLVQEADLLRRLAGKATPRLIDAGQDEHGPFVVTERVGAPSLASGASFAASLPEVKRAAWVGGAALAAFLALAIVHEATDESGPMAIVHADLSPDNVLVKDRATILDFSLASWRDAPRAPGGAFRGTLLYAAPEAARGEAMDPRSDLFALAASLLHVASGERPRPATEPSPLLLQAGEANLDEYARRAGARLDAALAGALARCLAFDREARPGSARDVLRALESAC